MPKGLVKTKRDERLWAKAKARVQEQYGLTEDDGDRYWALVNGIYQRMSGVRKAVLVRPVLPQLPAKLTRTQRVYLADALQQVATKEELIEHLENWADVKDKVAADHRSGREASLPTAGKEVISNLQQEVKEIRELVADLRKLADRDKRLHKAVSTGLIVLAKGQAKAARRRLLVKSSAAPGPTVFIGAPVPVKVRSKFKHIEKLVDDLHMTVLYIPEGPAAQKDQQAILDAIEDVTSQTPPLRCKLTGIGVLGPADEKALAALVTVANGAKFHAELCEAIAAGWESFERTYDFLPHVTLSYENVDQAQASDLRKVTWTADHVTIQFGKDGKPHRFDLRGPRSPLRVLFKGGTSGIQLPDALQKAVIHTPTNPGGSVAWGKVPVGASIWVTITKEGSPLRGRKLLLTKRPDQQFAVTGGTPFATRGAAGQPYKHLVMAPVGAAGYETEADIAKRREREAALTVNRPLQQHLAKLRREKRQATAKAHHVALAAAGIEAKRITRREARAIRAGLETTAVNQGADPKVARAYASAVVGEIEKQRTRVAEEQLKAKAKRARAWLATRAFGEAGEGWRERPEVEPVTTEPVVTPGPTIYMPPVPEVDESVYIPPPVPVGDFTTPEEVEAYTREQIAQQVDEALRDVAEPFVLGAPGAAPGLVAGEATYGPPGPGWPVTGSPVAVAPPPEPEPTEFSQEEALELLNVYEDFHRARLAERETAAQLRQVPEAEFAAGATPQQFVIEAEAVSEADVQDAVAEYESKPPGQRADAFYSALSQHWNEEVGYTLNGSVIEGASSALTGLVGDLLGRRIDIGRLVSALTPEGAATALAFDLRHRVGREAVEQLAQRVEQINAETIEHTEQAALAEDNGLKTEYELIQQQRAGGLLSEETAEELSLNNIYRRRRNLGIALGSMSVSAGLLASLKNALAAKDDQITILCGENRANAQQRLDELHLTEGRRARIVHTHRGWELRTSAGGLRRFMTAERNRAQRNGEWEALKNDTSPVTEEDTPPFFKQEVEGESFRLRSEQRNDIQWLLAAGGGLITRVTGSGKTISGLAFAAHKLQEDPTFRQIVIVPRGQVKQWVAEARKFTDLPIYQVPEGTNRDERFKHYFEGPGVTIVSHRDASFDTAIIEEAGYSACVLDEPQLLKSRRSARRGAAFKRITRMPFEHRIALTATPARQAPVECYNIVNWCNPGELGFRTRFMRAFGGFGSGINAQDRAIARLLTRELSPFLSGGAIQQRTFDVSHDTVNTQLSQAQKNHQAEIEQGRKRLIREYRGKGGKTAALRELERRHQDNLQDGDPDTNPKVQVLVRNIERAEGKHVVFVSSAAQRRTVVAAMRNTGMKRWQIQNIARTSGLKAGDVERRKRRWRDDPDCKILIIDKDSCSGHNLQAADTMHIMGAPQDAATLLQAYGRVMREPRVGDVAVHTYRTESPWEFEDWHIIDDQMKLIRATAPALLAQAGLEKSVGHQMVVLVKSWIKPYRRQTKGGKIVHVKGYYRRSKGRQLSSGQAAKVEEAARRLFGTTSDPLRAGFMLADGTMLDFYAEDPTTVERRRAWGIGRGIRHEDIEQVLPGARTRGNQQDTIDRFCHGTGALRLACHDDDPKGIWVLAEVRAPLSLQQKITFIRIARDHPVQSVYIDAFLHKNGQYAGTVDFRDCTPSKMHAALNVADAWVAGKRPRIPIGLREVGHPMVALAKGWVKPHRRRLESGKVVEVKGYQTRRSRKPETRKPPVKPSVREAIGVLPNPHKYLAGTPLAKLIATESALDNVWNGLLSGRPAHAHHAIEKTRSVAEKLRKLSGIRKQRGQPLPPSFQMLYDWLDEAEKTADDEELMSELHSEWLTSQGKTEADIKRERKERVQERLQDLEQRRPMTEKRRTAAEKRAVIRPAKIPTKDRKAAAWLKHRGIKIITGKIYKHSMRAPKPGEITAAQQQFELLSKVLTGGLPSGDLRIGFYGRSRVSGNSRAVYCYGKATMPDGQTKQLSAIVLAEEFTEALAHELAHYMHTRSQYISAFREISRAYSDDQLRTEISWWNHESPMQPRFLRRMLQPYEIFARVFEQWVTDKLIEIAPDDPVVKSLADHIYDTEGGNYKPRPLYFSDEFKQPVYAALEKGLKNDGLVKSLVALIKSYVKPHRRRTQSGDVVPVEGYETQRRKKPKPAGYWRERHARGEAKREKRGLARLARRFRKEHEHYFGHDPNATFQDFLDEVQRLCNKYADSPEKERYSLALKQWRRELKDDYELLSKPLSEDAHRKSLVVLTRGHQ